MLEARTEDRTASNVRTNSDARAQSTRHAPDNRDPGGSAKTGLEKDSTAAIPLGRTSDFDHSEQLITTGRDRIARRTDAASPEIIPLPAATLFPATSEPTDEVPVGKDSTVASDLGIRAFDICVSILAGAAFLPVLLLAALAIRLTGRGPILFVQQRMGRGGEAFPCLKFRSMAVDAQERLEQLLASDPQARAEWARDQKLRKDPRITPVGALLRKTSLDELPQLFNVLLGHMSIVGPRPIIAAEIERYGARYADYCSVRPGITGLWQISGRNDVSYGTRVRLDSLYARRKSLGYDVTICLRTIPAVLGPNGSY